MCTFDAPPQAGSVTAQLAVCPESQPCITAKGKVCLMQRVFGLTCKQLEDCMAQGGRAAIFYGQSYENSCQLPGGLELNTEQCGTKAWVPTIGISRAQAEALIDHHDAGKLTGVSVCWGSPALQAWHLLPPLLLGCATCGLPGACGDVVHCDSQPLIEVARCGSRLCRHAALVCSELNVRPCR
jgi:hypothetical protein